MPKKTKQYGWQCSECDKDPGVVPISFTPQVDLEAPRSSRARGSHSRVGSLILSRFHLFGLLSFNISILQVTQRRRERGKSLQRVSD